MMNTKHYLDKSIDEYMKAKKEIYQNFEFSNIW